MADYTHEFSNFPEEVISIRKMKDIDDSVGKIINQYMVAANEKRYDEAARILKDNNIDLQDYIADSNFVNTLIEHIRNTQIFAKSRQQCVHTGSTVVNPYIGDVWIGGA